MRKAFLFLVVALFAIQTAWADDITATQALQIAKQFAIGNGQGNGAKGKAAVAPSLAHTVKSKTTNKDNVYVINLGTDQGFVLISGDDDAEVQILGYCDHGTFDYAKAPVQLHDLLAGYSGCIDKVREPKTLSKNQATIMPAKRKARSMGDIVVGPLLTTTWDQNYPFNKYCPDGCPAGCVPVAYAQVMNYWHWPEKTKGMVDEEDFSGRSYDWEKMRNEYSSYDEEEADAVARLIADVGKACGTTYSETGSSTLFKPDRLIENFDYWPDVELIRSENVGPLFPYIQKELDARRPVLYCGYSGLYNAYHALVCDGYTTEKYMHFNYGWGGYSDGWFYYYSDFSTDGYIFANLRPYDCEEVVQDDVRYRIYPNGEAEIVTYEREYANDVELTIPATINDSKGKSHNVVRILSGAFSKAGSFSTVTIGENITGMEHHCFTNSHIDKLILNDKVEVVPDYAFQLTDVTELIIGASVKHIGKMAFAYCPCSKVTSKSPAFTVGKKAFINSSISNYEWLGSITELADSAFIGAVFGKNFAADGVSPFKQLRSIGKRTFDGAEFPNRTFYIPASLKRIDAGAFGHSLISEFVVEEGNSYFRTNDFKDMLFNKSGTSLVCAAPICKWEDDWLDGVVRLAPYSIPARFQRQESMYGVSHLPAGLTIPNTVEDVTGAFSDCTMMSALTCNAVVPPVATDDTFGDYFFKDGSFCLYVPKGTADLYAGASGWRRFTNIVEMDEYNPAPPSTERQYYMVLHCSDPSAQVSPTEGRDETVKSIRIPVSDVHEISMGDYVTGSVPSIKVSTKTGSLSLEGAEALDSITWTRGFVYGDSEVFDIDPDNRVAEGQNCTVNFGGATISGPAQVSIKDVVVAPKMVGDANRVRTLDISLSTGEHQLNGTAQINIPIRKEDGREIYAAYYNPETGEWEPVLAIYNAERQEATILTDHLSLFEVGYMNTRKETMEMYRDYYMYEPIHTFNAAVSGLLELATSDDPDALAFQKAKEDLGNWTTTWLDGVGGLAQGLGWTPEAFNDAVGKLAWVSTASTLLDVVASDIKGDNVGVAANSLKTVMSIAGNYAGTVLGTQMLSLSMGAMAFIGIAIDHLGTTVKKARMDYVRSMYHYYYSPEGASDCGLSSKFGQNYYRNYNSWYNLLAPAIKSGKLKDPNAYIEQVVRRYCDQFWEDTDDVQQICGSEANRVGFSSSLWITEAEKQAVCDEYFAELINGDVAKVVSDIRWDLAVANFRNYRKAMGEFADYMNTKLGFIFSDSSCPAGVTPDPSGMTENKSKYSGWTIRFTEIPSDITDPDDWQNVIDDTGSCRLGFYTLYTMSNHKVKPQFTLLDQDGVERATYDYQIPQGSDKIILNIDLATCGTTIANPHLDNLTLLYDTGDFDFQTRFYWVGVPKESYWYHHSKNYLDSKSSKEANLNSDHSKIAIFNSYYIWKNYREQSAVEQWFNDVHDIKVDAMGTIFFDDKEVGKFPGNGMKGSGKFNISVKNPFHYRTADEYVQAWNEATWESFDIENFATILDINLQHDITCNFDITRTEDNREFDITYYGEGTYVLDLHYIDEVKDLEWTKANFDEVDEDGDPYRFSMFNFITCPLRNVNTTNESFNGKVTLDFSQKIKVSNASPFTLSSADSPASLVSAASPARLVPAASPTGNTTSVEIISDNVLALHQVDGAIITCAFEENPVISYTADELVMTTRTATVSYPLAYLRKLTLEGEWNTVSLSGIDQAIVPDAEFSFTDDGANVRGEKPGTPFYVFDTRGVKLYEGIIDAEGKANIGLSRLPHGIYLVKTQSTSFKIKR